MAAGELEIEALAAGFGLEMQDVAFMFEIPDEQRLYILTNFSPGGSQDGNILGRLMGYAKSVLRRAGVVPPASLNDLPPPGGSFQQAPAHASGAHRRFSHDHVVNFCQELNLPDGSAEFLSTLPEEVLQTALKGFDPTGTKDGNVWGRLFGYIRSHWQRHLQITEDVMSYIKSLPDEVQAQVLSEFDASGSKDGNVSGRLMAYAKHLASRMGAGQSVNTVAAPVSQPHYLSIDEFAASLGLDESMRQFLIMLPSEVMNVVINSFDPSGTVDGNIWGRLFGFVRSVWQRHLQVNEDVMGYLRGLPEDVQARIVAEFDASASWDGNNSARLMSFARRVASDSGVASNHGHGAPAAHHGHVTHAAQSRSAGNVHVPRTGSSSLAEFATSLGLDRAACDWLRMLPQDLLGQVMLSFDPAGTKDGNVWGRLFGYIRSHWKGRLQLTDESLSFLKSLPEDVQMKVIAEFDAGGSKDGNASARMMGFAQHLATRGSVLGGTRQSPRSAPQRHLPSNADVAAVQEFVQTLGLDDAALVFLQQLPGDFMNSVMSSFDPSGTKDGNIWGRLFGFIRIRLASHFGWDEQFKEYLKGLQEDQQKQEILNALQDPARSTPRQRGGGGGGGGGRAQVGWDHLSASRVADRGSHQQQAHTGYAAPQGCRDFSEFCQMWGLNDSAQRFLEAIPLQIQDIVLASFDGSATKDGNVWGRLLGFVRFQWGRSLGLDPESLNYVKSMPEDAQMILITEFDARGTKDGNIAGRVMGFAKKAMASAHSVVHEAVETRSAHAQVLATLGGRSRPVAQSPAQDLRHDPAVQEFIERCGLDDSAVGLLEPLDADTLANVLQCFDPTGTKDGNVLGRLSGYIKSRSTRRNGNPQGGGPPKRPRFA
eukprot:TRINITY_DN7301_c0_g1_i1.p1 TRINITY_DN7301_c0_g1~~TRINITY_DN7301_c0_g1_i1.p1  ORF type:complete len:879 (+),score=128.89 TRINITY_DN7301_c0_g1_i1:85-2721(+)